MHLRQDKCDSRDRIYPGLSIELPLPFTLSSCPTGQSHLFYVGAATCGKMANAIPFFAHFFHSGLYGFLECLRGAD